MNIKQMLYSGFGVMTLMGVFLSFRGGVEGPATAVVCYGAIGIGLLGSVLVTVLGRGESKPRPLRRRQDSRELETLSATCRNCGKKYQLSPDRAGQRLPCKACGEMFRVPGGKTAARAPAEWETKARSGAITLMVLGMGSFILPLMGLQFQMFSRLGDAAQVGGTIAAILGAGLFAYIMRHNLALGGGVAGGVAAVTLISLIVHLNSKPEGSLPAANPQGVSQSADHPSVPAGQRVTGLPISIFGEQEQGNAGPGESVRQVDSNTPSHPQPISSQGKPSLQTPSTTPPEIRRPRPLQEVNAVSGEKTPLAGGNGGSEFALATETKAPVVGVRYDLTQWGGGFTIRTLEPIGQEEQVSADENTVLGKPGYTLVGMHVHADNHVRGVRLIFAKQDNTQVDLSDSYESDWLGVPANQPTATLGADGRAVMGIYGRKGLIMDALGLVMQSG